MNDEYTQLAYDTIVNYIKSGKKMVLPNNLLQKFYKKKAGVFVSLHHKKTHDLMGCIGTFMPTKENIGQEIIDNAISAATSDPRFVGITVENLPNLNVSVDILSELEKINGVRDLNPTQYGIFIKTADSRSALLLPDIEGVATVEQQLEITRQKGGIAQNEPITIYRFTVTRHKYDK